MEILKLFPTVLYKEQIDIPIEIDQAYQKERYARNGQNNGWLSRRSLHKDEIYKPLIEIIDTHINKYCFNILKMDTKTKISCCGSWINLHKGKDFSQQHRHSNAMISGILYLSAPKNSAPIIFHSDPQQSHMFGSFFDPEYTEYNEYNSVTTKMEVKTGTLLLFPSTLFHSVPVNSSSDIVRVSFAFDYMITETINTFLNEITIKI